MDSKKLIETKTHLFIIALQDVKMSREMKKNYKRVINDIEKRIWKNNEHLK